MLSQTMSSSFVKRPARFDVELVDVGGGNVGSVRRALQRLGVNFRDVVPDRPPSGDCPLILPGVGAFGTVMRSLSRDGLDARLRSLVKQGTPLLGICVGMQVLFDCSEEAPGVVGLGLIQGRVVKFNCAKVPQIGWNLIEPSQPGWDAGFAYFVNSFYVCPANDDVVLYTADYESSFCAGIACDNVTAFQFHPEKSGAFGSSLLARWIESVS
jgi:imidazole glycerol phosphate synthase glutamine amidotransferase subunit